MAAIPTPKSFKRLGNFAIDEDSVFTTQAALDAYLAGGTSYAGQVVALVLDSENEAQIFKVNKDKSLGSVGEGTGLTVKQITQQAISITAVGTTDIPINNTIKTLSFADGVDSQSITASNLSDTDGNECVMLFDNSANNSAVTLTWPEGWYWDDSCPSTGISGIAALSKYEFRFYVRSASIVFVEVIPLA